MSQDVSYCIGFSVPLKDQGWFTKAILLLSGPKWYKKAKWSHAFTIDFPHGDGDRRRDAVLEAGMAVQVVPLSKYRDNPNMAYVILRLKGETIEDARSAVDQCWLKYTGHTYGWKMLLWFAWRWLWRIVGKEIGRGSNFFPEDEICSEVQYNRITLGKGPLIGPLSALGTMFTDNTCSPTDLWELMKANWDTVEFVEGREWQ